MNQFQERVFTVRISNPNSPESLGQLYVRFQDGRVYMHLYTGGHCFETDTFGRFLDALRDGLLPQIPGASIALCHTVRWRKPDCDTVKLVELTETWAYDECKGIIGITIGLNLDGSEVTVQASEPDIVLMKLLAAISDGLNSCLTCSYAAFVAYGDEDVFHGWHCFRDAGVDPSEWGRWWEHEQEFSLAHKHYGAFHWCPAYKRRTRAVL